MSNRAVFATVHQKLRETGSYDKVFGRGARTADPRPLRTRTTGGRSNRGSAAGYWSIFLTSNNNGSTILDSLHEFVLIFNILEDSDPGLGKMVRTASIFAFEDENCDDRVIIVYAIATIQYQAWVDHSIGRI
ncbi:hypothetical protein AVEN_41327-1 [Araneus ventricosus]|uniref:Uncharacterized protein n=1 Tax=Araneus ventricosus TaxID=182803 RepID=A0A4Y2UNX2_ARAVE|nr:hypothetical protein AVEN_41327-1 [Araneus ventricosus]